jgi:hypothetical protein
LVLSSFLLLSISFLLLISFIFCFFPVFFLISVSLAAPAAAWFGNDGSDAACVELVKRCGLVCLRCGVDGVASGWAVKHGAGWCGDAGRGAGRA